MNLSGNLIDGCHQGLVPIFLGVETFGYVNVTGSASFIVPVKTPSCTTTEVTKDFTVDFGSDLF